MYIHPDTPLFVEEHGRAKFDFRPFSYKNFQLDKHNIWSFYNKYMYITHPLMHFLISICIF